MTARDGIKVHGKRLSNLRYADDTVLLADSAEKLQDILKRVADTSSKHGLYLNSKKTKVMVVRKQKENITIKLHNEVLEQVENYKYFRANISEKVTWEQEIKARMVIAKSTLNGLQNVWRHKGVRIVLKIRLVKALIWSIAIYGCEAWTLNKAEENTINAFEMWVYRRMLRISYTELERIGETQATSQQSQKNETNFLRPCQTKHH